jgi:hypothetical protein
MRSTWRWKGRATVVVVGVGTAMALAGSAGATGSDGAASKVTGATKATKAAWARSAVKRAAGDLATTGVQRKRPCRMFTMGTSFKALASRSQESELVADVCDHLRTACARGGDCSMYMCCAFGDAFCMT